MPEDKQSDFRLSVSKTKSFEQCKKQYQFNYILKLPKKSWDFHILGSLCHAVLEEFHQTYLEGCLLPYHIVMNDSFKSAVKKFEDKMTPEIKRECWEMIDKYLRLITKQKQTGLPANVIAVEKKFEHPLTDQVCLNGFIDRVQLDPDGVLHVADYKTTKNKKYLKDDWFQLLTYSYILLMEDPSLEKVRASYILLRHDFEYLTKEFHKDEILSVKDKYLDYANKMMIESEFPATTSRLCSYCSFLDVCPQGKSASREPTTYGEVSW